MSFSRGGTPVAREARAACFLGSVTARRQNDRSILHECCAIRFDSIRFVWNYHGMQYRDMQYRCPDPQGDACARRQDVNGSVSGSVGLEAIVSTEGHNVSSTSLVCVTTLAAMKRRSSTCKHCSGTRRASTVRGQTKSHRQNYESRHRWHSQNHPESGKIVKASGKIVKADTAGTLRTIKNQV